MGKYKIKIEYSTGNSFGTNETSDLIELEWDNIDTAKENLKFIQEHHIMNNGLNSYYNKTKIDDYVDKEWFVYKPILFNKKTNNAISESNKHKYDDSELEYRPDKFYSENCINLKADNGNYMQMYCFWCGYFERLIYAEIIEDKSDMKIYF